MKKKTKRTLGWISFILILALGAFIYFKFYFVFSEGTQTGELNKIAKTGYVFKTYGGVMILTGYGHKDGGGTVQSNEFKFSVDDEELAKQMLNMTGSRITVHYKKYFGRIPWRGYEKSIVDSVLTVERINYGSEYTPAPENQLFL